MKLGKKLEFLLDSIQLPADVTIAVSASPRDVSYVIREDAGLIGAPGGWELLVQQQRLFSGLTEDEAIVMTKALLQIYQKQAYFLETLSDFITRIGIVTVREEIFQRKFKLSKEKQMKVFAGQVRDDGAKGNGYTMSVL